MTTTVRRKAVCPGYRICSSYIHICCANTHKQTGEIRSQKPTGLVWQWFEQTSGVQCQTKLLDERTRQRTNERVTGKRCEKQDNRTNKYKNEYISMQKKTSNMAGSNA